MERRKSCLLVVALVCAAAAICAATPEFRDDDDQLAHSGTQVHVVSVKDDESTTIRIQNRLPKEDEDKVAMRCSALLKDEGVGELDLEEYSPYATVWATDMYGPVDSWVCGFEWVDHSLVIDTRPVWHNEGSVVWKIDAHGLALFHASDNSYEFITPWESKSSGTVSSA